MSSKKFIVSQLFLMALVVMVGVGCAQTSRVYYITTNTPAPTIVAAPQSVSQPVSSSFTVTDNMKMKWVCMKHQHGCKCTGKYGSSGTLTVTAPCPPAAVVAAPTFRWIEQQQPTTVQQVVVQPPPVVVQPVYVEQPVVYQEPRTVYYSSPLISASASISVNSYSSPYYTGKEYYWGSPGRERFYIDQTRYNYGIGGGRSYGGNHGGYGGGYGGGIRPMPPVNYMPGVNGVQLGGGYGGNHGGGHRR